MPLQIIKSEITDIRADSVVYVENEMYYSKNMTNSPYAEAGSLHKKERMLLGECAPGKALITGPEKMNCKYVIHTTIPDEINNNHDEETLSSCYNTVLSLAKDRECSSIAIPLLYMNTQGYNKEKSLQIAENAICGFLNQNDITVYLSIPDKKIYQIDRNLQADLEEYILHAYLKPSEFHSSGAISKTRREKKLFSSRKMNLSEDAMPSHEKVYLEEIGLQSSAQYESALSESLNHLDESFTEMLLRKIDCSGMTDVECYKRANIDRKLFSKIRSDKLYRPSKQTVIAFSIALELSLDETNEMLKKAGFALSHSNKFDIIIEYFINKKIYDIFKINEALYEYDQPLLGV